MKNPYLELQASGRPDLADLGWQCLKNLSHGDLPRWLETIDALTEGDGYRQLDRAAPVLGRPVDEPALLRQHLLNLHPWRKGPLELGGVRIDTEWRSDWKWESIGTAPRSQGTGNPGHWLWQWLFRIAYARCRCKTGSGY